MSDRVYLKDVDVRVPKSADRIGAWDPGDAEGGAVTPPGLAAFAIVVSASAPTSGDDASAGHWVGRVWLETAVDPADSKMHVCTKATAPAAWKDVTAELSVTGLTNPLTGGLNGNGHLIYGSPFAGFRDRYYDLSVDSGGLITAGVAQLIGTYNAYQYPGLDSALEIRLPDHTGVPAADALFGVISVELAAGGSVTLAQTVEAPWLWELASDTETDPVIPSAEGSYFRLRYAWDPVAEVYVVSRSIVPVAPPAATGMAKVVVGSWSVSALSQANKETHVHTHTLISTVQDGKKLLIVGFVADGDASPSGHSSFLSPLVAPPGGSGTHSQAHWFYYAFDSDDILAGEVTLSFTKANEMAQIFAFEVEDVDITNPLYDSGSDRSTSSVRAGAGPVSLDVPNGGLMLASVGVDILSTPSPATVDVDDANSHTELGRYTASTVGSVSFIVMAREVSTGGTFDSPSFERTNANDGTFQLEALVLAPAP